MILCCGESLIDMLPATLADGGAGLRPLVGGSVFNTAIALGRLEQPVALLTGLSSDMFGAQLEAALVESGVDTSVAIRSDRHTTLALVRLVDGQASYDFMDENSAGRMLRIVDFPPLPDAVQTLYFGGISLACEPCADAYAAYAAQHAARALVMLDPNVRPDFIADRDRFVARLTGMMALADVVKFSDDDLNWFYPGPETLEVKARRALEAGAGMVIVTRGADGAFALRRGGARLTIASPAVAVVDTVGAGDTFNAGFLARLTRLGHGSKAGLAAAPDAAIAAALDFAARVAAVTVSRAGANPPWANEIAG